MEICSILDLCGFSSTKTDYSDYLKSLISRINEAMFFFQ